MVSGPSLTKDDALIDAWFRHVQEDELAKKRLADAIRAKDASALTEAIAWVFVNIIKPTVRLARDVAVKLIVGHILGIG